MPCTIHFEVSVNDQYSLATQVFVIPTVSCVYGIVSMTVGYYDVVVKVQYLCSTYSLDENNNLLT